MSKQELDKSYFVSFCIEQYKQHAGISGEAAAALLFDSGVAAYLSDNFEVLHSWKRSTSSRRLNEAWSRVARPTHDELRCNL